MTFIRIQIDDTIYQLPEECCEQGYFFTPSMGIVLLNSTENVEIALKMCRIIGEYQGGILPGTCYDIEKYLDICEILELREQGEQR